ncbi:glycosyltransferase family 2 protein [Aquidulcibacter sp.]|uniref:glycosyltransferase family 2 protein n=1 Tax=Aquidulcibacter sp. TaxID=2052990 RepID=UPI0037C002D5
MSRPKTISLLDIEPNASRHGTKQDFEFLVDPACGSSFDFGKINLGGGKWGGGWWLIDFDGDDCVADIQLLTDDIDFIVLPLLTGNPVLLRTQAKEAFVQLFLGLPSGRVRINKLEIRPVGFGFLATKYAKKIVDLLTLRITPANFYSGMMAILTGTRFQTILRTNESQASHTLNQQDDARHDRVPDLVNKGQESWQKVAEFWVKKSNLDHLDSRAVELASKRFEANPMLEALIGSEAGQGLFDPATQWDNTLSAFDVYDPWPVFVRSQPDLCASTRDVLASIAKRCEPGLIDRLCMIAGQRNSNDQSPSDPFDFLEETGVWPKVSVIIPTKVRLDLLALCLRGLNTCTDYPDLEILIVDNGAPCGAVLDVATSNAGNRPFEIVRHKAPFNFAELNNLGVETSKSDLILLLNDDVCPLEPTWLKRMISSAMKPNVGAVGARLLYSDGTLQHGGVTLGLSGLCGHLWRGANSESVMNVPRLVAPSRRLAVTAACLAVKRSAWQQVSGMNNVDFPVTLNDIDFCLRLESQGLETIYRGDAVLLHDESKSRGTTLDIKARQQRWHEVCVFREKWQHFILDDPFGSPLIDPPFEGARLRRLP